MRGYVTIDTADEFQKWMSEQEAQNSESPGDSVWK
jgi:heme/copper-type cytochrome/quinol oxidase subunit 2